MSAIAAPPTPPTRSAIQRANALEHANEIRCYRARFKLRLKAGDVSAVPVLLDPVPELATMKVIDLLLATPRVGCVKANKILARARISPSKTLVGLSPRQRGELVSLLRPYTR